VKYGVRATLHSYWTTVNGRRYRRYKIVVRDPRVTGWLARRRRYKRLRRLFHRYKHVVFEVLTKKPKVYYRVHRFIPRTIVMAAYGIKPFNYWRYRENMHREVVKRLKPNWRARNWYIEHVVYGW